MTLCGKNIEEFRGHLLAEEKSSATVEKYVRDAVFFIEWLNGREVTKETVMEYKEVLSARYKPSSVNAALASLGSLFTFIGHPELRVKSIRIQRKIFAEAEKELSEREYNRLLETAKKRGNERIYHIMMTICAAGLRVSELKYITVDAVKKGAAVISCKGKIRRIILSDKLRKTLKDYIKRHSVKSGSVFVTRTGKPVDRSNIWRDMKKLCEDAGVVSSKVYPHNLRHLFARIFYSIEKDIVRLADILGHSSINTTRIYTIESGDTHMRLLQKMNLVQKWITT